MVKFTNLELDFTKYGALTFEEPDTETFYALELAKKAGREGGSVTTVFNSADEAAVERFLKGEISYLGITESIEYAMQNVPKIDNPSLEDIMNTDKLSRELVYKFRK